jgi:hypothetical protein
MALLGHVARLVLHSDDQAECLRILAEAGYEDGGASAYGRRVADGQLLMLVHADAASVPSLLYAAASLQSVADRLTAAGVSYTGNRHTELNMEGPGSLRIRVVSASADDMEERSGLDNPVLGFLDSIVVPVADAAEAAVWAQRCGFFILETSDVGSPMVDVTDGLVKLSFRVQQPGAPYLHYTADVDSEWGLQLTSTLGESCRVIERGQQIELARIDVAGALQIMVTPDDF